ncbi:MAG: trypsin-like peptidase domain-containing protein [bacterium]|nr:MAG: trypsin-like peptidase domain-containing protein [bacterium]
MRKTFSHRAITGQRAAFQILVLAGAFLLGVSINGQTWADDLASLRETSDAFVQISRKVTPSVVNIKTFRKVGGRGYDLSDRVFGDMLEPFREFFGRDFTERFFGTPDERMVQQGLGSGVIVRDEGVILTNNHVIRGADEILVTLGDRTELKARVIGSDPRTDIAVLRLPEGTYPSAVLGDSDAIEVGEWVIAIGNPFGLGQSVTVGVVSAKGRANVGVADLEDFIQTDAAINPGNSGGPLIDLDGRIVGINTAIFSRSGGYQGIGFAVPVNMARAVMKSLLKTGRIVRSDLGIRVQGATEALLTALGAGRTSGVIVSEVIPQGVGDEAGILRGDLITRIKGREIRDTDSYYRIVSLLPIGEEVPVVVMRDGLPLTVMVKVGELPSRPQDTSIRLRTALGFSVEELTEENAERLGYRYDSGVLITRVVRMGQADRSGLEPGDLIIGLNDARSPDLDTFRELFEGIDWGEEVRLVVKRAGRTFTVTMVLRQEG